MDTIPMYKRLFGYHYTNGGSQQYTREYTWEDSRMIDRTPGTSHANIINAIYNFFKEHPEKLLEGGPAKEQGCTVDQLRMFSE